MISGKNYRKNSKNSRKFGYSLITVNFTVVFPEKFYPCIYTATKHGVVAQIRAMKVWQLFCQNFLENYIKLFCSVYENQRKIFNSLYCIILLFQEHNEQFGVRIMCICPGLTRTGMANFGDIRLVWPYYANQEVANNFHNRHFQK